MTAWGDVKGRRDGGWSDRKGTGRGSCDPDHGYKPGCGDVPLDSYFTPQYTTRAVSNQTWVDSSTNDEGQLPADGNITGV